MRSVTESRLAGRKHLFLLFMPVLIISLGCARARAPEEIIADAAKTLASLKTYSAVLNLTQSLPAIPKEVAKKDISGPSIITDIRGRTPDRLAMDMRMEMPDNITVQFKMVFDGNYQWVESISTQGDKIIQPRTAFKINLKETTTPEKPFDTFYYLWGSGLVMGYDLPGSIKTMLRLYDFKKSSLGEIDGVDCDVLEGEINMELFKKEFYYTYSKDSSLPPEKLNNDIRYARIYFAKADHFAKKYEMGPEIDKPAISVVLNQVKLNPELPADAFVYKPPEGLEIQNGTGEAIKARKAHNENIKKAGEGK